MLGILRRFFYASEGIMLRFTLFTNVSIAFSSWSWGSKLFGLRDDLRILSSLAFLRADDIYDFSAKSPMSGVLEPYESIERISF